MAFAEHAHVGLRWVKIVGKVDQPDLVANRFGELVERFDWRVRRAEVGFVDEDAGLVEPVDVGAFEGSVGGPAEGGLGVVDEQADGGNGMAGETAIDIEAGDGCGSARLKNANVEIVLKGGCSVAAEGHGCFH